MDINKIENRISGSKFNKTDATSKGQESSSTKGKSQAGDSPKDKVSLGDYPFRNNDQLFAKLELEKLNDSSTERLQEIKTQLKEFKEAGEASSETELGQKINDPSVWEDIAHKILR